MESSYFVQAEDIISCIAQAFYPDNGIQANTVRTWDALDLARRGL